MGASTKKREDGVPSLQSDEDDFVYPFSNAVLELLGPGETADSVFSPISDNSNLPQDPAYDHAYLDVGSLRLIYALVNRAVLEGDTEWLKTDGNYLHGFTSIAQILGRDPDAWRLHLLHLMKKERRRCRS